MVSLLASLPFFVAWGQGTPVNPILGPVPVVDVRDGDTVVLESNLGPRVVRLIGIDTPEVRHPERGREPFGPEASDFTKRLLPDGTMVHVEIDIEAEDAYGRLLAYLYLSDEAGGWMVDGQPASMVNLMIASAGYARALTIEPNAVYADLFDAAVAAAQAEGRGMWVGSGMAGSPAVGDDATSAPADPATDPLVTDEDTVTGGGDGGDVVDAAAVRIACVLFDPVDGEDERVFLTLSAPLDLRGYFLHDADGSRERFPLPTGVHPAGWLEIRNAGQQVWNNGGDTVYLKYGRDDTIIDAWDYRDAARSAREGDVVCRDGTIGLP